VRPIPVVGLVDLPAAPAETAVASRLWMRALSFAALAFYGVERWGRLMRDPPVGRLAGLAGAAVALVVIVPLARSRTGGWPVPARRLLIGLISAVAGIGALAIAGLRWEWVTHVRLAVSARAVGHGLGSLGGALVPYLGHSYSIRLVMMLGVAVLLLDAAAALAYAGRAGADIGDGRRAAAALPLVALAIVPATLVPPASAALQGLLLFGLLALFVWGERITRDGVGAAVGVACAAGVTAAIVAPQITSSQAWVDYRAWAGGAGVATIDHFSWNQSYGPLNWPQDGRVVLTVHAREGEYWKAEDLTRFTGTDWVAAQTGSQPALPGPSAAVRRRYTQSVAITLGDIATREVIGGSGASTRPQITGGVAPGAVPGTWIARRELSPGDAYTVRSYSPQPSPAALARAGAGGDPWSELAPDLSLTLPQRAGAEPALASITFPAFHRPLTAATAAELSDSPYAPAVTIARRLAARAATPYAFVASVAAFLDDGRYTYDQATTPSREPLLSFLFDTHRGYCQQFSGAMALLLRMGGMPARVAAGFTSGLLDRGAGTWTVTDIDAHAWVEAWFAGYGWVRFDPTPSSAPALGGNGDPVAAAVPAVDLPSGASSTGTAAQRAHPHSSPAAKRAAATRRDRVDGEGRQHPGATGWPWIGGGAALAAALVAALVLGAGLTRRRDAGGDPIAELERALARTGQPLRDGVTLAALETRFADSPAAAGYIRALRLSRYGGGATAPTPAGRRALRTRLRVGLGHAGWLRALWALPPHPRQPSR
jgi:transglutaminase-like putative cysteine protease